MTCISKHPIYLYRLLYRAQPTPKSHFNAWLIGSYPHVYRKYVALLQGVTRL